MKKKPSTKKIQKLKDLDTRLNPVGGKSKKSSTDSTPPPK